MQTGVVSEPATGAGDTPQIGFTGAFSDIKIHVGIGGEVAGVSGSGYFF